MTSAPSATDCTFGTAAADDDAAAITLSPHNFHTRRAKKIMASLDDLEAQRVKPFERLCFVLYVMLYMLFVFLALSFVKLLTESQ
jgi:hypothetical protein